MTYITCHHDKLADIRLQDGGLPHVLGACNYQVVRASSEKLCAPEGRGFTYNHAPMLAYWNQHFLYEYLAGPKGEHETPSAAFLCLSSDGIHWEKPMEVFPSADIDVTPYLGPKKKLLKENRVPLVVHHRMGFYTSKENHMLVSSFYGISPEPHVNPNNGFGVGRVVREIYSDFTMSDVFFIRCNGAGGYGRDQIDLFRYFEESDDPGFVDACRELLADRLTTQQWWEEERLDQEFFTCTGGAALSYYTLPDGRVMGVFKNSLTSVSEDQGESWSPVRKSPSIITSTGKVWGERMPDGQYALVYNPSPDSAHRWPLAITTGENGEDFYHLAAIVPEIAPCRYEGIMKNLGAQYMRGITESNQRPKDHGVWISYSINKEDMWIARVPNPIRTRWQGEVHDVMKAMSEEVLRNTWNLYVPSWGAVELEDGGDGNALYLADYDPYNRVRAERMFEPAAVVHIGLTLQIIQISEDKVTLCVESQDGQKLVQIVFCPDGQMAVRSGGRDLELGNYLYQEDMTLELLVDCAESTYSVTASQGRNLYQKSGQTGAAAKTAERFLFTTKYSLPFQGLEINGRNGDIGNLERPDREYPMTRACIKQLDVTNGRR